MLNDRFLMQEIKRAYRNEGYTVQREGGRYFLKTGYCALSIDERFLPRKILGLLVEHIGEIPEDAWHVVKGMAPQREMDGICMEIFDFPCQAAGAKRTCLMMDSYEVWQSEIDLTVALMDGDLTGILPRDEEGTEVAMTDAPVLYIEQGGYALLVVAGVRSHRTAELAELGRVQRWRA